MGQLRGRDSTGVASVKRYEEETTILKEVGPPENLFDRKSFYKFMEFHGVKLYMAHNRAATIGNVNRKNAHPFHIDHIIGCHNGTLSYHSRNLLEGVARYDTDSEAIFQHLSKHDLDATLRKTIGAYALSIYDTKTEKLIFTRNKERTLYYNYTPDKKCLFWASEPQMLIWIMNRNGYNCDKPYVFTEDSIFEFEIPSYNGEFKRPMIRKVVKQEFEIEKKDNKKAFFPTVIHGGLNSTALTTSHSDGLVLTVDFLRADKTGFLQGYTEVGSGHKTRMYKGWHGNLIARKAFETIMSNGCAWCGGHPEWGKVVRFIDHKDFVCNECLGNKEVTAFLGS